MATISYLSGAIVPAALGQRADFGVLLTPLMGNRPPALGTHAHDNGVWSEFTSGGKKPFRLERYLDYLESWAPQQDRCLFAPAPDVVGDWRATIERSRPVFGMIKALGYKVALCAQNGMEEHLAKIPWREFDVLFLGGGKDERLVCKANPHGEWKLSRGAQLLAELANRKGKTVHMGRVNSFLRLRQAQAMGCASADGTIVAFGPSIRTPEVQSWLDRLN